MVVSVREGGGHIFDIALFSGPMYWFRKFLYIVLVIIRRLGEKGGLQFINEPAHWLQIEGK